MLNIELPDGKELTEVQVRVLRLKFEGLTSKEAGRVLSISPHTVAVHLNIVYHTLGTHSVLQTMGRLQQLGLLESVMRET